MAANRFSALRHSTATPPKFNNKNSKARFLLTGFNNTYNAHAAKTKNTADTSSVTKPKRKNNSEPIILLAVAAASPDTIIFPRTYEAETVAVSYTHLTLPTNREV